MNKLLFLLFPSITASACILLGLFLTALFPVPIQITKTDKLTTIQVDGVSKELKTSSNIKEIHFHSPPKYEREFQIDGSDSITYYTFDKEYFREFSEHPYYQFQSFLRNETSYNQLANIVLSDEHKRTINEYQKVDGKSLAVPDTFTLSMDLRRPEKEQTFDLVYDDNSTIQVTIDRLTKRVTITRQDFRGIQQLSTWYFPFGSEPFLAEIMATLLNAVAVALLLMTLLPIIAWFMPRWKIPVRKFAYLPLIFGVAISAIVLASCYISIVLFDKAPYILDGASYYFQGKIIADGMWTAPIPAFKDAFPLVFFTTRADHWFSTFPPGTALFLAPGFLLNIPWLVEIILASLTAILIFLIGEKLYNRTIGTIAMLLFASSPFVHLQAASFMSHIPALFVACLGTYLCLLYLDKQKKRYIIVGSLLLGLNGLIREFTPIVYGMSVGIFTTILAYKKYGFKRIYRHILLALLFGSIGVACYFIFYHYAFTNSFTQIPREIAISSDKWGFGQGIGFYGQHTLASGLANTDQQITNFLIYAFGWPYYFAIAFIFIPFITRRENPADYLSLSLILGYILSYIGAFYHGIAFGPRHYFELLPGIVFLTARGFIILAEYTGSVLHTWHRSFAVIRAAYAMIFVVILLMLCNVLYFEPRLFQVYKNFADIAGKKDLNVQSIFNDTLAGRQAKVTDAVIMTDNWYLYNTYFSYLNCPRLNCQAVYALAKTQKEREKLIKMYPDRKYYTVKQIGKKLVLDPINTAP